MHFVTRCQLDRRTMLRGAGVAVGLPWLSAMQQAFAKPAADGGAERPRRFVAMTLGLGLHAENLEPVGVGSDYEPSRYLRPLEDLRDRYTVVTGSSHPGVTGGHRAEASLLTATPVGNAGGGRNTISFDQYLAKHRGHHTRYPSLVLSSRGTNSPSYTENGSMIPAEDSPSRLFRRLFVDDTPAERTRQADRAKQGRSIMDLVGDDANRLSRELGRSDRDRLDAYLTSVRELEHRLAESEAWASRPKPKVGVPVPQDVRNPNDFVGMQRLMSSVVKLALETDSSRFVSYHLGGSGGVVPIDGVEQGYHALSHHGKDGEKLEQLALVEEAIVSAWGDFLRELRDTNEQGESLLDRTSVLLTSNLGNASNHDNRNMPVLFAGGGFAHGQHLAFDKKRNYALPKLFVSVAQQTGLETDSFSTTTGTMQGLEPA